MLSTAIIHVWSWLTSTACTRSEHMLNTFVRQDLHCTDHLCSLIETSLTAISHFLIAKSWKIPPEFNIA